MNEPRTNPLGLFKSHQWVYCERNQGVRSSCICWAFAGYFVKELREYIWKVPTGYFGGHFLNEPRANPLNLTKSHWWVLFEWTQNEPAGFIQITSVGTFQKNPPLTHWVCGGRIVSEPTMNPQCTRWVYAPSPPVYIRNSKQTEIGTTVAEVRLSHEN